MWRQKFAGSSKSPDVGMFLVLATMHPVKASLDDANDSFLLFVPHANCHRP